MVAITGTRFTHLPFLLATPEAAVLLTFCIIDRFSWLCFPELPFCWPLFIVKLTSAPVNPVHKLSNKLNKYHQFPPSCLGSREKKSHSHVESQPLLDGHITGPYPSPLWLLCVTNSATGYINGRTHLTAV